MVAESDDGLLFSTVQVYSPPVVTVRVCVYCAVSVLSNTVTVPVVTMVESLVQVTVVAGPPVEIQVRVSWSESNVTSSPIIVMSPRPTRMSRGFADGEEHKASNYDYQICTVLLIGMDNVLGLCSVQQVHLLQRESS